MAKVIQPVPKSLQVKLAVGQVVADGVISYQREYASNDILDETISNHLERFFDVVQFVKYYPIAGPTIIQIKLKFVFFNSSPKEESLLLTANLMVRGPGSIEESRRIIIEQLTPPELIVTSFPDGDRQLLTTIQPL